MKEETLPIPLKEMEMKMQKKYNTNFGVTAEMKRNQIKKSKSAIRPPMSIKSDELFSESRLVQDSPFIKQKQNPPSKLNTNTINPPSKLNTNIIDLKTYSSSNKAKKDSLTDVNDFKDTFEKFLNDSKESF